MSDLSLELDLFLWQNVGCALPKSFNLSIGGNSLKVVLCQIEFCLVEHFSALQYEIQTSVMTVTFFGFISIGISLKP